MNKLFLFLTIACISFGAASNAQAYSNYMQQGKAHFNNKDFKTAVERFTLAYDLAKTEEEKNDAKNWKDKSLEKIGQIQKVAKDSLAQAEIKKRQFETAMFDKAVKEYYKGWKGYENYLVNGVLNDEGTRILEQLDSLDLSQNDLSRIPVEVLNCPKLKYINILGNPAINWRESVGRLVAVKSNISLYVSVKDFDNIPGPYQKNITGIEVVQSKSNVIPANILSQKQLIYIDICINELTELSPQIGDLTGLTELYLPYNKISKLPAEIGKLQRLNKLCLGDNQIIQLCPEIGKLKELSSFGLWSNRLKALPPEIGNLIRLKELNLSNNQLNTLPAEFGKLRDLEDLDLSSNQLSKLPPEMGKLAKLGNLNLSKNHLSTLPVEIKNLKQLKFLELSGNPFSDEEKQKIKQWLPACEIKW